MMCLDRLDEIAHPLGTGGHQHEDRNMRLELQVTRRLRRAVAVGLVDDEDIADLEHSTREMADIHRTLLDGTPDRRIRPLPDSLRSAFDAPDGPHAKIAHFLNLANSLQTLPTDSEAFRTTLEEVVSLGRAMC